MKKGSPLIIFFFVIIAPVFVETLGYILIEIGFHFIKEGFTNPLSFAITKRISTYLPEVLYVLIILKIHPVQIYHEKAHILKNMMLPFAAIALLLLIKGSIGDHDAINIFFAKVRDEIHFGIKSLLELIPRLQVDFAPAKINDTPAFTHSPSLESYFYYVLSLTIFAPIFEELIFRYFVLRLSSEYFGLFPGVLLSSLSFAVMHKQGDVAANALVMGVILGCIYVLSHYRLWVPILAHFLNNAIVAMNETARLIKKADLPIGFPTDTETAYQFTQNASMTVLILGMISVLILLALYSKQAFSLWRGHSLAEQKPVAPTS